MSHRIGIYLVCLVFSYIVIRCLLSQDVSAALTYCALAAVLGRAMYVVITGLLPKQLLPDLHKKAIFITGCDSGFGYLLAQRLDSLGVVVYAGCLFPEGSGAKELKEKCSDKLHIVALDVTSNKLIEASVEYVKNTLHDRVLWAVVNNAGISSTGELEWHSIETAQNIMDVNHFGQVRIVKAFLPLLRESRGRIVNVLSAAGFFSSPWLIPYNCSKFAARALTEGLRIELRKFSISVHGIAPYFYMTPIMNGMQSPAIWDGCPKDVKAAYGHDYNDIGQARFRWIVEKVSKPSLRLSVVVDCMVDASFGINPQDVYLPSLKEKLLHTALYYSPRYVVDLLYSASQPSSKSKPYWNESTSSFNILWRMFKERE